MFVPAVGDSIPKCAKGSTFCEEVDQYPAKHIEALLSKEHKKYEELFGSDLVIQEDVKNRFSNGIQDEESLCTSTEEIIYPQSGLTKDNTWMFIVNYKNYTQGVRVEKCM